MTTTLSSAETRLMQDILIEQLKVNREQLLPHAKLHADLGSDSLSDVEIVMAVEDRFQLVIPDDLADQIETVGDLEALLAQQLAAQKPATATTKT